MIVQSIYRKAIHRTVRLLGQRPLSANPCEDGSSWRARAQQPSILDFGFMKASNSFRLPKTLCFHEQGKRPASLNFHSLLTRREHQTPSNSPRARCALRQMTANPSSSCTCTSSNVEADKWLPSAGSCDGTHSMIARMVNKVARANYCDEPSGEFGLRLRYSILSGSPCFVAWELGRECNQSCQQYRSDNDISPEPATNHFLIFRIEPVILVDHLTAHRPLLPTNQTRSRADCQGRI